LTLEQAQYYGGIPSLIYCSRENGLLNPAIRFRSAVDLVSINMDVDKFIAKVTECILTGNYLEAPKCVRYFESFASVTIINEIFLTGVDKNFVCIRWPLLYIVELLRYMYSVADRRTDLQVLSDMQRLLEVDFLGHASREGSGAGWEIITKVAILLHCVCAYTQKNELVVMNVQFGNVTSVCLNRLYGIETLEHAKAEIERIMQKLPVGAIVMFYPSFASFPFFDALLVYNDSSGCLVKIAIQDKLGMTYPVDEVPEWITLAVLIQGNTPETRKDMNIMRKWVYLTRLEVNILLGASLSSLNPVNWKVPLIEDQI
jgi:hypothetical protein